MAITEPILKLGPPDFAWQQIQIIPTDDVNNDDYNDDNDVDDDDDDDNDDEKPNWP